MGPRIRVLVEGFLRGRYGLAELGSSDVFRVLALAVLIGAIGACGWLLLIGPLLTIPRFTTEGPVVRNGVSVIVACGEKRGMAGMGATMRYAPEPRTGGWWPERKGECTVWYHRPPGLEQRSNRQERASFACEREKSVEECASGGPPPPGLQRESPSGFQKLPVIEKLPSEAGGKTR